LSVLMGTEPCSCSTSRPVRLRPKPGKKFKPFAPTVPKVKEIVPAKLIPKLSA
jgi:hypothetical protein